MSFKEGEPEEFQEHVDELCDETGYKISRNQFIRRAALAFMRYQKAHKKGKKVTVDDVFKETR